MKLQNDESFEKGFREAFDKASLAPPDVIWENIEKALPAPTDVGLKPDANYITATKIMVGAGVAVVSGLLYFYLNTKNNTHINKISNTSNHEKTNTIITEPANLEAKFEKPTVAAYATFVAKKQIIYKPKPVLPLNNLDERDQIVLPETVTPEDFSISTKINEKVAEITPKGLSLKKITMDTPDLVPNTNSQTVVPYYDPNALPSQQKNRGQFWQNFKIRGGIRVSN